MKPQENTNTLLAEYYAAHVAELRTIAQMRVMRRDIAEDIVQDAFLRLLRVDVLTSKSLPGLLFTVIRNMISDYWRHRRAVVEFEHLLHGRLVNEGGGVSPESVYSAQEVYVLLENGIARLTPEQQQVYKLHIYNGMKVSEISETLQVNYRNVERRLGVARKQVRGYVRARLAV